MLNHTALDERIGKCRKILNESPNSQIFAALADAQRKKGELDAAFRTCRQGLRLHPDYGAGHMIMARINFDRKMYDWAESELLKAIEMDGRTRATDLLQAEIHIMQNRLDHAKILVDDLAATDPGNDYFRELLMKIEVGKAEEKRKHIEMEKLYKAQSSRMETGGRDFAGEEETSSLTSSELLQKLSEFPGMIGCFFAHQDGMMVEAQVPEYFDRESYAALSAEIYRFANENMAKIKFGKVRHVLIELSGEKVMIVQTVGQILVLVMAASANLGSLKLKLSSVLRRLAAA